MRGRINEFRQAVVTVQLHGTGGLVELVEAVIDTGFDGFLTLTPEIVNRLELPYVTSNNYELGDGREVRFDLHEVRIDWNGRVRTVEALVTDGGVLIGMSLFSGHRVCFDGDEGGDVVIRRRYKRETKK